MNSLRFLYGGPVLLEVMPAIMIKMLSAKMPNSPASPTLHVTPSDLLSQDIHTHAGMDAIITKENN